MNLELERTKGNIMSKISMFATAIVLGASLVGGIAAVSAETGGTPSAASNEGMMNKNMMPMMQQMSKMMDNCNKMMQSAIDRKNHDNSGQNEPDKRG